MNVSSTGIDVTDVGNGIYAMTKAGVAMMSMFLATEGGPFGVRVNSIAPGATVTAFSERHKLDADGNVDEVKWEQFLEAMRAAGPLHMVGEAIDQAMLILYLVSPAASLRHRQHLPRERWPVDGLVKRAKKKKGCPPRSASCELVQRCDTTLEPLREGTLR